MKPKWIVENYDEKENYQEIFDAITSLGLEYKVDKYVPFEGSRTKELFPAHDCVVAQCSLQMARFIQKNCSWVPGVYLDVHKFECTTYYNYFGKFLLNSNYIMLPFAELIRQKQFLMDTLSNNGCLFMRPSSGLKYFTGKVVEVERYEREIEMFGCYDIDPWKVVVVASPQNILREWRLAVVEKRVVASSLYRVGKDLHSEEGCPLEVTQFAEEVLKTGWEPDLAWTMDICETSSGMSLLEIGSISCSGLYACNKKEIVKAVSDVALKDWESFAS